MSNLRIYKLKNYVTILTTLSMLLLFSVILPAQNTFNKKYDFTSNIDIANQLIMADGAIFMIGTFADTVSFSYKIGIIKTDMDGNVIWKKKYGIDSLTYGMLALSPALLYEDSIIYIHVFRQLYGSGISKCALMKLNTNGDLYWEKEMPGNDFEVACGLVENNGSLYLGGVGYPDGVNRDAFIYKVNLEGDSIFKKYYYTLNEEMSVFFRIKKGSSMFVTSSLIIESGAHYYGRVQEIDTNLSIINTAIFKGIVNYDHPSVGVKGDGYTGTYNIIDTTIDGQFYPKVTAIFELDDSLKITNLAIRRMKEEIGAYGMKLGNTYYIVCFVIDYITGWQLGYISKYDSNANVVWERRYYIPDSTYQIFSNVELSNQQFCIVGTSVSPISQEDYWLVKLDSFGCLTPGCQLYDGIVDLSLPSPELSIKISPNPATESCNFYVEGAGYYNGKMLEVSMYDLNGKKHWQASQQILGNLPQFTISRKKWASGMYILKATVNGKEVGSEKLVWK